MSRCVSVRFARIALCLFFIILLPAFAMGFTEAKNKFLDQDDKINLYCLRAVYPEIIGVEGASHDIQLILANGKTVPYTLGAVSVRKSLEPPYPLEPKRVDTPPGQSPGRMRPYALLEALYGASPQEITPRLVGVSFQNKKMRLAPQAAKAFNNAKGELSRLLPQYAEWLRPEGGYYWRNIAGEANRSAHSYGIALDLGVKKAPYWRWSKVMPHPLQKTYPSAIVDIMERNGFIWGGKWHEYDLMHYEYRPEILCKARIKKALEQR